MITDPQILAEAQAEVDWLAEKVRPSLRGLVVNAIEPTAPLAVAIHFEGTEKTLRATGLLASKLLRDLPIASRGDVERTRSPQPLTHKFCNKCGREIEVAEGARLEDYICGSCK
jgi:hypothetical protein